MLSLSRLSWLFVFGVLYLVAPEAAAAVGGAKPHPLGKEELEAALMEEESPLGQQIRAIEDGITAGSTAAFDQFLEANWLLDRVTCQEEEAAGRMPSPSVVASFRQGALDSWRARSLASEYVGSFFRYQRVIAWQGRWGLLFRAVGAQGQLNFILLTLARGPDDVVRADDALPFSCGEFVSETLRRHYLTLLASLRPQGEMGQRALLYMEHLPQVLEFNEALGQGNYAAALALHERLPAVVQQDRTLLLGRLTAAEQVSPEAYAVVFAEWQRLYPDPMSLPLRWVDHLVRTGRYEEAEHLLRRLDEAVGGDPWVKQRLGDVRHARRTLDLVAGGDATPAPAAVSGQPPVRPKKTPTR